MRKRHLIIVTALLLCIPALAQDMEPKVPLRKIIYVPREEFMRVIDPARRGRVIELEEYMRLERLAAQQAPQRVLRQAPPLAAALTSAHYRGMVGEAQAAIFARYEFSTLVKGWVTLSVELSGAALANVMLDGRDALIRPARGGFTLLVPKRGDHVLHAMLFVPVRKTTSRKKISVRLPATGATSVILDFPGNVELKSSAPATQTRYDDASDMTTAEIFLGKDTGLTLTFRGEEKRARMQPFIRAHTDQHTTFDLAGSRTVAAIVVNSHRAPLGSLLLKLDPDARVCDLQATDMLDWDRTTSRRFTLLEIRFRKPVQHAIVNLTLNREATARRRKLPLISLPQAGLQGWLLHVSHAPDVRAEFVSGRNVRQVVRARPPSGGAARSFLSFESARSEHEVVFRLTPVAPHVASVMREDIDVRRERILLNANCLLRVLRGRKYEFTIRLPGNWEILQVQPNPYARAARFDYSIAREGPVNVITLTSPLGVGAGDGAIVNIQARLVPSEKGGEKWEGLIFDLPRLELPGTQLSGGTVTLSGASYLALSTSELKSLRDMDVAQTRLASASLAYRVLAADYAGRVRATKKIPRVVASVTTALSINERLLGCRSMVSLNIFESPIDSFQVALPKGTGKLVQFHGSRIKERALTQEQERDLWKITLQKEVQGNYQLFVTFDTTLARGESGAPIQLDAPKIEVVGAYRQDGYVAVEAGEGIEIGAAARNMEEVYVSEVPQLARVQSPTGTGFFVHAFRYSRPGHALTLDVRQHELSRVITSIVGSAACNTLVTQNGRERTEAVFNVKSTGEQFFSLQLPPTSKLWSVLLGRDPNSMLPVKPLSRGDEVLVPLTGAPGPGTDYFVKVVYERLHPPMGTLGTLSLDVPRVTSGPVVQMAWRTFVPRGYRYWGHSGALTYDLEEPVGETIFDSLFYPVLITALIALSLYLAGASFKYWPKIRISPSLARYTGVTIIVVCLIALLIAISLPNLLKGKMAANESSSIANLRTISSAQELFHARNDRYATLTELSSTGMIDSSLADATSAEFSKGGYYYEVHKTRDGWYAHAYPSSPAAGTREFFIDQSGAIQYSTDSGTHYTALGGRPAAGEEETISWRETRGQVVEEPPPVKIPEKFTTTPRRPKPYKMFAAAVKPIADFRGSPTGARAPLTVNFTDLSTGSVTSWEWDFDNDGVVDSRERNPRHTFSYPGTYTVKLKTRSRDGSVNERRKRAIFKTPYIDGMSMADAPVVLLEEEVEITKDIPDGTSFDRLSNKNLDKLGKDFLILRGGGHLRGRLAGRGPNFVRLATAGGVLDVPTGEIDSIRHADGRLETIAAPGGVSRKGLLSMPIRLRWTGERGRWSALSGGGAIELNYIGRGALYATCFLLTFGAMIIFMVLERKGLHIKVLYGAVLVVVCGSLPSILGAHHYPYCNALLAGLVLGIIYYQVRNLVGVIRANIKPVIIAAAVLALTAGLLLGPRAASAQDRARKDLPPIKPADLVVPYELKDLLRVKGKGSIVLSEERYLELLARAGLLKHKVKEKPPAPSAVSSAYFEATLLADRLDVRADYAIAVLAKGERRVQLGLGGLAISDARLDGKPATLIASRGGYAAVLTGPCRARLTLGFSLPRDPRKVSGSLSFRVEPVTASVLDVRMAPDTDVRVLSAAGGQREVEGPNDKLVRAVLGPLKRVSISWYPHKVFSPALGLRSVVSSRLLYRIDSDLVQFDATYNYSVHGEEMGGVSFTVPDNLEIFKVSCPELRLWRLVEGTPRRLEIVLQSKGRRNFAINVSGALFPPEDGSKYPLPVPRCREVERETGTVILAPRRMMRLQVTHRQGLRRAPGAGRAPSGYEIHSTYTYLSEPFEVEVLASPRKTDLRAETHALLVIGTEQTFLRIRSKLESAEAPVYDLYVEIPSGFEIDGVSCGRMKTYFVHKGKKSARLHLVFPDGLGRSSTLVIECIRRTPDGGPDITKEKIPVISIAGAKRHRGEIAVAGEPGLAINTGELAGISQVKVDRVAIDRSLLGLSTVQQAFKFAEEGYSGELLVTRLEPRLSATAVTALTVRGEVLAYAAIVEYRIENAGCLEFRFKIPAWVRESLSIQGPFLRENIFSEPDARGQMEVTVKLQHDVLDNYSLVLYWEADPKEATKLSVPVLEPLGVEASMAYVVVQATADLRFMQRESQKVDDVDSSDVPHIKRLEAGDARVLLALKAVEFPYLVSYELERPKVAAGIDAIIDNAEYTAVINESCYSYNRASFHIQNRAKQYLKLRMPEGAVLWTADVAGVQVKPARLPGRDGSIVLIPLLKRSEEDISYFVSVYYGLQLPGAFGSLEPMLAEPLEISVEETYVSVYLPQRYTYTFDTDMDEVIKSVKEVAKGKVIEAEIARIAERMKTESDPDKLERQIRNLEALNPKLVEQARRARMAQKFPTSAELPKQEEQVKYNLAEIQRQESGAIRNLRTIAEAEKRHEQLERRQQARRAVTEKLDIGDKLITQAEQRAQQERLQKFVFEQDKSQRALLRSRYMARRGKSKKLAELLEEDAEVSYGKKKEERRDPSRLRPQEEGGPELTPDESEPLPEPPPPQEEAGPLSPAADFFDGFTAGRRLDTGKWIPTARAAGVRPLRIDLPERGVSLHFKKLGANPKLTLYGSSATAPARWGYALRMLVALGLLAFCVWQGISLFGEARGSRLVLEGVIAVVLIMLVLGSTVFAIMVGAAVGLYIATKYSTYLQRLGRTV